MYSRFVFGTDARELRAVIGLAGGIAGKIARELAAGARARVSKIWNELRENADRGARGWR